MTVVDPNNRTHNLKELKGKSDQRMLSKHHMKKRVRHFSCLRSENKLFLLGQRHRSETKGMSVSTT